MSLVTNLTSNLVSGLTSNLIGGGNGGASDISLQAVESSTCFDCDATIATSYDGTGTWKNLVPAPADGSDASEFDMDISAMGFSGTIGDPAARLTTDGVGAIEIASPTATLYQHMARSGTSGWLAWAWKTNDGGQKFMFDNRNTADGLGTFIRKQSSEQILFLTRNGGGAAVLSTSSAAMPLNTDTVTIVSWNGSDVTFWVDNSGTGQTASVVFTTDTSIVNDEIVTYYQSYAGFNKFDSSTVTYGIFGGNEYLDNTRANAIVLSLNSRHSRTYW